MELFKLEIVTQDTIIYQDTAESVTAPASEGEVTILAHHAPFFSRINPGQITIRKGEKTTQIVVGRGFIDVSPDNIVSILIDSATRMEDIDAEKAQKARERAEKLLAERVKLSRTEIVRAEASLRKAVLELKLARKKSARQSPFSP